jgi:hypothetical protein
LGDAAVAIFHRVNASWYRPTSIHIFRAEKEWGAFKQWHSSCSDSGFWDLTVKAGHLPLAWNRRSFGSNTRVRA